MTVTQITSMIICLLGIAVGLAGLIFSIYKSILLVKDKRVSFDLKPYLKKICIGIGFYIFAFTGCLPSIFPWNGVEPSAIQYVEMCFGGLFFNAAIAFGINAFIIHYYGKDLSKLLDKTLFIILIAAIPVSVISFFVYSSAFADLMGAGYILPNGLSFTKGFVSPNSPDKPNIAFYAICIVAGATLVYFLSDHYMYREYGKHGTLETCFFTAFPAGILGARIAYVIGNWTRDGFPDRIAKGEWWSIFAIWEGGLTILGGAIAGIAVGVLVYIKTNKGRSIWRAIDLIVPTILIAQAIGRWGNFFNCEVHGGLVEESAWLWLPRVVFNNAHYSSANSLGYAPEGYIYAPLFFIEFLTNLLGYFVLAHLFGIKWKKILMPGDLGAGYLIWYGYTRVFMEPLRHPSFKMGANDYWSWTWALIFVTAGALLIAVNHIIRFTKNNKTNAKMTFSKKNSLISLSVLCGLGLGFVVAGIVIMILNPFEAKLEFTGFNIGIIFLASGVSFIFLGSAILYELLFTKKHQEAAIDA